MGLPLQQIDFDTFGGGNWSDQPGALIRRSHQQVEGGFSQVAPVESPNLENVDFIERAIGKRKGSALLESSASVLISGDVILDKTSHNTPGTTGTLGTEVQLGVGQKGIYTNQSGSWARLNNANGTAFQWPTDIAKVSFVPADGHMFIMPDQGTIQVYRSGTGLDDQLRNSTTETTVDVNSASGQKVLSVAATTMFRVGDRVNIDADGGGDGQESGYVASISAGVSITLEDNLSITHTSATADDVKVDNLYTEAKGGGTQSITGDWQDGTFMGFYLHQRLCFGIGNSIWEFTDSGQPWDLLGGGFYQARGNITAAITLTPKGASELQTVGFLSTSAGPEFVPGFDLSDTPKPMQGGSTALNHRVIATIDNWIVYMTTEGGIEGANYGQTIDLGRRFKTLDGVTGPLDTFDPTNTSHQIITHVFYNQDKKQLKWRYPDGVNSINTHAVGLDFYLGEPVLGEPLESFESRVRCLYDSIKQPTVNPWFIAEYKKRGRTVGVLATGVTYTMDSGDNDLDTIPVLDFWETPNVDGGFTDRLKIWRGLFPIFKEVGDWNVEAERYINLSPNAIGTNLTFPQVTDSSALWNGANWNEFNWAGAGVSDRVKYNELNSKYLRVRFFNQNTSQNWILRHLTMEYQVGARSN